MNRMNRTYNRGVSVEVVIKAICICIVLVIMIYAVRSDKSDVRAESNRTLTCCSVLVDGDDTLWSLASEYYSEEFGSIQNQIDAIKETNKLGSDTIKSGYNIIIPYYE